MKNNFFLLFVVILLFTGSTASAQVPGILTNPLAVDAATGFFKDLAKLQPHEVDWSRVDEVRADSVTALPLSLAVTDTLADKSVKGTATMDSASYSFTVKQDTGKVKAFRLTVFLKDSLPLFSLRIPTSSFKGWKVKEEHAAAAEFSSPTTTIAVLGLGAISIPPNAATPIVTTLPVSVHFAADAEAKSRVGKALNATGDKIGDAFKDLGLGDIKIKNPFARAVSDDQIKAIDTLFLQGKVAVIDSVKVIDSKGKSRSYLLTGADGTLYSLAMQKDGSGWISYADGTAVVTINAKFENVEENGNPYILGIVVFAYREERIGEYFGKRLLDIQGIRLSFGSAKK